MIPVSLPNAAIQRKIGAFSGLGIDGTNEHSVIIMWLMCGILGRHFGDGKQPSLALWFVYDRIAGWQQATILYATC